MVLTVIAVWLGLSALATVACALVARGGLREEGRRGCLDDVLADDHRPALPSPRVPTG